MVVSLSHFTAVAILIAFNRFGVTRLSPYLLVGLILWVLVLRSGIHATLAGVVLAFAIPMECTPGQPDANSISPLHRLEHPLHFPVGFLILPIFGLANAAVPILGLPAGALTAPVTLGVAAGTANRESLGVFGFATIAVHLRLADMPSHAGRLQMFGVALLCGIGFTMSIFITLLAFPGSPLLQGRGKDGCVSWIADFRALSAWVCDMQSANRDTCAAWTSYRVPRWRSDGTANRS